MNFSQIFSRADILSKTGCKLLRIKGLNLSFSLKSSYCPSDRLSKISSLSGTISQFPPSKDYKLNVKQFALVDKNALPSFLFQHNMIYVQHTIVSLEKPWKFSGIVFCAIIFQAASARSLPVGSFISAVDHYGKSLSTGHCRRFSRAHLPY